MNHRNLKELGLTNFYKSKDTSIITGIATESCKDNGKFELFQIELEKRADGKRCNIRDASNFTVTGNGNDIFGSFKFTEFDKIYGNKYFHFIKTRENFPYKNILLPKIFRCDLTPIIPRIFDPVNWQFGEWFYSYRPNSEINSASIKEDTSNTKRGYFCFTINPDGITNENIPDIIDKGFEVFKITGYPKHRDIKSLWGVPFKASSKKSLNLY